MTPQEIANEALFAKPSVLHGTRATSIIEFGRIVHAEMSAITDAARRGLSVKNARLFCTTFPCHMCARHIIASGIREVIYVEPYPKSMARILYPRMLRVDHDERHDEEAVEFRPFLGVAPRRYLQFFEMPARKDSRGHVINWKQTSAWPRVKQSATYLYAEAVRVDLLQVNSILWEVTEGNGHERIELAPRTAEKDEAGGR